ncbi:hypothetical protein [Phascolarctobacterium succinatutens]|jgi:hypothetical protein|uniref:hypothetical protein n=1 Tax=Phascolarctobacterium succinatutens TaxID=626940 RepID=UPI0020535210|nr:hypothetical protein [Phascolarctobacterium succinatutens]DAI29576.1 MAG TPA: hypothetical protein [Caudoviricetes sp.]
MTEHNEFTSFIDDELERVGDLFAEKQQQYSAGADPLSNFRTGALLEHRDGSYEKMYEVAKGYLNKHIAFLYDHGIVDKTEESLRDMVVYGLIMLYMVKKNQELAQVKE